MQEECDSDREVRLKERLAARLKTLEEAALRKKEKWRPYWHRGQKTLGDREQEFIEKQKCEVHPAQLKIVTRRHRMYHSSLELRGDGQRGERGKSELSKSLSFQNGLHRFPGVNNETNTRSGKPISGKERLQASNSTLALPKIEVAIELDEERDGSHASNVDGEERNGDANGTLKDLLEPEVVELEQPEEEEDVYLSDDDPEVSRRNLDRAGDYIVEHDWILKENLAKEARKVNILHKKVRIPLSDEDPMDTIKNRLDEISLMVKPKAEYGNFIETIDPEQRARIMKYKDTDSTLIRRRRRENWKAINRFRDAGFKVILLYRASDPRKKYLHDDKPDLAPGEIRKLKQKNVSQTSLIPKSSLGMEVQLALMTQSDFRSNNDVKRITWVLRATKAFKHLFPAMLEEQLARVVAYERYDDKRIVANQGRYPERFYYILTGKLQKVREYRLLSGLITRNEGVIEKGHTTDPEEMSNNWPREHHLVSKGQVEVLVLEKSDFLDLLHTCKGPPIDFLQKLDLFKEFPCEEFLNSSDAIDFRYYGQDKIVVKDTNRTPWIHVVKTGTVKVVRVQTVIDVQNETKFVQQSREELGTCRPFSHASAMLGILAKQRKMKSMVGAISLPEIIRRHKPQPPVVLNGEQGGDKSHNGGADVEISGLSKSAGSSPRKKHKLASPPIVVTAPGVAGSSAKVPPRLMDINEESESSSAKSKRTSFSGGEAAREQKGQGERNLLLPPINDVSKSADRPTAHFHPHGTYLTREQTEFDPVYHKKQKKEQLQRKAHLQLDVLKPGDVFGLEHMDPQALASEAPGVTLISDGAEIIKISKRFFLTHAQNNTMLKVETMQRDYMTTEEAKTVMYDKETWNQYKAAYMRRTVENLYRNKMEKA